MYLARSRRVRLHFLESLPGFCRPTLMDANQILVYRNWTVLQMPDIRWCGLSAIHMHTLSMRHNKIRDITANWIYEVCHNVKKEPALQPLTGDTIILQTANRQDNARADIRARGFGGQQQCAFFDITVFHPNAQKLPPQQHPSNLLKAWTSKKKRESIAIEKEKLNQPISNHLFLPPQEERVGKPLFSTVQASCRPHFNQKQNCLQYNGIQWMHPILFSP